MFHLRIGPLCISAALLLSPAILANGLLNQTWVSASTVGDDSNDCSRATPCKTFVGAIAKTVAGGEISVLDPGGYGGVTITKSIRIDGSAFITGVLVAASNGIVINAGPTDVIVLKGLTFDGSNIAGAYRGIKFMVGGTLEIENCEIFGFGQRGISIEPTNPTSTVSITNTVVNNSLSNGILVVPGPSSTVNVWIDNVHVRNNTNYGISVTAGSSITIHNSEITGNGLDGLRMDGTLGSSTADLDGVTISGNTTGIEAITGSTVRVSNSNITSNVTGLLFSGGAIQSFGDNLVAGNPFGNTGMSSIGIQ